MSEVYDNSVTYPANERLKSLFNDFMEKRGLAQKVVIKMTKPFVPIGERQVKRYLAGDAEVKDKWISGFASFFGVNEDWLRTGEGEMHHVNTVGESPSSNPLRTNPPQKEGDNDSSQVIHVDSKDDIPEKLIAENALKIINFNRMKKLIKQGAGEEAVAFEHIYWIPYENENYKVRFVAYVEKEKTPPAPEEKPPARED